MGEWTPEPLPEHTEWISGPGSASVDPADRVTLDESVNLAFLVVLEAMTPAERVAFILHDVFCHSFAEVAEIVGRTPAACRQLASSARRRIRAAQPQHRKVRARVEHTFSRMKNYKILRDCRQRGDGLHHAVQAVARMHNLALAA